ncbi:PhzF family phenazine biosynthesis protein [Larkinella arboricola]|uniref:PhzF family phenazine biosynthesis protein n=1 Tax=Larkinella arboricola TaxID=643671 RepID=A0A327WM23_LARAB|nr:PhzF family phenazine biosynthesis protein [Larkinella arboricola]RAJ92461.1 PhzF family phenazine biosynthesis protein [Larkinella arboricola]
MQTVTISVVTAFVDGGTGGNPAGIVLDADRFDQATKQRIATRVGLSETAFVSASAVADFNLEFFTPVRQIAHCGHATIAAFSYLAQQGILTKTHSSRETVDGPRSVYMDGTRAFMEQAAPTYQFPDLLDAEVTPQRVLQSLGLSSTDLLDDQLPLVANTGNSFLLIPVRSAAIVERIRPDLQAIEHISERLGLVGYYVFSPDTQKPDRDAGARMFAPAYGIPEEAATGMAAGPLACYLYDYLKLRKTTLLIEQGHLMQPPSPSLLTARLQTERGLITGLLVGGSAQVSHTIEIGIPTAMLSNYSN